MESKKVKAEEELQNHMSQTHFKDDRVEGQKSEATYFGSHNSILDIHQFCDLRQTLCISVK